MHIIQIRNRSPEALNSRRRTVLSAGHRDIDMCRPVKRPLDLVVNFGGALAQIRPLLRFIKEAMLVGTLSAPDYTGGSSRRVETGVGFVAFVGVTELAMDGGGSFFERHIVSFCFDLTLWFGLMEGDGFGRSEVFN